MSFFMRSKIKSAIWKSIYREIPQKPTQKQNLPPVDDEYLTPQEYAEWQDAMATFANDQPPTTPTTGGKE